MKKVWMLKEQGDPGLVSKIAGELGIFEPLANILVQRGVHTYEEAKAFFRPELSQLHDPYRMSNMDKAIERIEEAIANEEKILIYGDYDVDGTSAVALVFSFFRKYYDYLDFYIPDRYQEGYGISVKGIDFAAEHDYSLIIALDCGIKAVEKVAYANEKNIDFIICDHHRPGDVVPDACAILDPKLPYCNYPYKELSGCGIGFKLIQAYAMKNQIPFSDLEEYLDLVAISIASDIVDITGENRILAYYGLKSINQHPRPGIEAILTYARVERSITPTSKSVFTKELSITDLVFLIGPRINAAGRIENGRNSVELLKCQDKNLAASIADQINNYNTERKNLDSLTTQQAIEMIENDERLKNSKSSVVYNPEWHKGVIGIVASRLTETYYRPTIVFTQSNGLITGSARSVKDFDIYDAIDACSDLLEHFGGHKYAAGLSLKPENFLEFSKRFEEIVISIAGERNFIPVIEIDSKLNLNMVNSKFVRVLKQFAPFGPGNMTPVFMTTRVKDTGQSRLVKNNHLKLDVFQPETSSFPLAGIAFQQGAQYDQISRGKLFNICYHLEENVWNGKTSPQLVVKDIQFEEPLL